MNRVPAGVACLVWAAMIGAAPSAVAQYAPGMDGRANDANNQVGSGGYNAPVQRTLFNTSNLYVTGNVTAGRSFRGYSPIRDSSSLFLSVPSGDIGTFTGNSIGLPQVLQNQSLIQPSPFFNPATTVSRVDAITLGYNAPGSSVPRSTYLIPQGRPQGPLEAGALNPGIDIEASGLVPPNSSIYTAYNLPVLRDRELSNRLRLTNQIDILRQSPVFGNTVTETRSILPEYARGNAVLNPYDLSGGGGAEDRLTDPIVRQQRLLNSAAGRPTSEEMLAGAGSLISPSQLAPKLFEPDASLRDRDALTGRPLPEAPSYAAMRPQEQDTLSSRDPMSRVTPAVGGPPGQLGETIAYGPQTPPSEEPLEALAGAAEWLSEVAAEPGFQERMEDTPALREQYERALSVVRDAGATPLHSLSGQSRTSGNDAIARAEEQMRQGQYYQASTLFDLAVSMDPDNAMIRLGHGHALLAAGEYLTAVVHLTAAIKMYPAFGYLNLDLNEFVKNPNLLDVRRADLEGRLSRQEDYRLRFLLGYIEYYTGLEKFGLPNLERAAREAPEGSVIARFPEMLKEAERLPVPPAQAEGS